MDRDFCNFNFHRRKFVEKVCTRSEIESLTHDRNNESHLILRRFCCSFDELSLRRTGASPILNTFKQTGQYCKDNMG